MRIGASAASKFLELGRIQDVAPGQTPTPKLFDVRSGGPVVAQSFDIGTRDLDLFALGEYELKD